MNLPNLHRRFSIPCASRWESHECVIARANHHVTYPANIQLVAAMNPCRCGKAGEPGHVCARGRRCQADYQARISGPLLDRIDLRIQVPAVSATELIQSRTGETSAVVAKRVARARELQAARFRKIGLPSLLVNAQCPASVVEDIARPDDAGTALLQRAAEQMKFSARGYHRVLKLARTLADLDGAETVGRLHLAEAISYRLPGEEMSAAA